MLRGDDCAFEAEHNTTLHGEVTLIKITVTVGSLEVQRHSELTRIRIRGRACTLEQGTLDQIQFKTEQKGNEVSVEARVPSTRLQSWGRVFKKRSSGPVLLG